MSERPSRYEACVAAIDRENAADPELLALAGVSHPQALLEGRCASGWLERIDPEAPEPLRLAVRAHHIRRWAIPRNDYPRTREGYHAWRTRLYDFHAEELGRLMAEAGYTRSEVARSGEIMHRRAIKTDPEVQAYEDAVSLAFLEVRLKAFAPTVSDEQLMRALRRTWRKMSPAGHEAARSMPLAPAEKEILAAALSEDEP